MKTINHPEDPASPKLFADEELGWWATRLGAPAYRKLQEGWQGVFRRSILKLMPAQELGQHFSEGMGRPSKELYSMAGLMLIAEFRDFTGEQAAEAYTFDASVQFALNLPRDGQYLSARSVDNYRSRFRKDEHAQRVFEQVTMTLVEELQVDISRQRLDSTHVLSHMARMGRQQLLAVGVRRFVVQLGRRDARRHQELSSELRGRYEPAQSRLFGQGTRKEQKREEAIEQIGRDMAELLARFEKDERISVMPAYKAMARLFEEHFEPVEKSPGRWKLRQRSLDEQGGSRGTLQNPSDLEAGYSGHKGPGYQAQLAQALPPRDAQGRREGPGLITAVVPQSAAVRDNEALCEVLSQQERTGLKAGEMTADTIYGSDENVEICKQKGVRLISPVVGVAPSKAHPKHNLSKDQKAHKQRLQERRAQQETPEWRKVYATRSGIEGLHRALDVVTGFKQLRVRGLAAVGMALPLKAAGWNIAAAAKILASRRRRAPRAPWRANRATPGHVTLAIITILLAVLGGSKRPPLGGSINRHP